METAPGVRSEPGGFGHDTDVQRGRGADVEHGRVFRADTGVAGVRREEGGSVGRDGIDDALDHRFRAAFHAPQASERGVREYGVTRLKAEGAKVGDDAAPVDGGCIGGRIWHAEHTGLTERLERFRYQLIQVLSVDVCCFGAISLLLPSLSRRGWGWFLVSRQRNHP